MASRKTISAALFSALVTTFVSAGCNKSRPAPPVPLPPVVTVAKPLLQDVIEWDTYTGYFEAKESVNVSARVSGMILAAPFAEGSLVKKSQVLYQLDERPYKADYNSKIADEAKAKSQVALAKLNFRRQEELLQRKAGSQQDYDTTKAEYDKAVAELAGVQAALETSRLNLDWCQVTSPIDGRVGQKLVTVGNLINGGAGQATLLTTIQSVDPIYCNFDVDEHSIQKYQKLAVEKKRQHERDGKVSCFARLGDEEGFHHAGYIDFLNNRLDTTTGTQRMRGLFQNITGALTPGFYASLRIPGSGRYQALLVPDSAIGSDQSHRTVLVVNAENIVEVRIVGVGALFGDLRSITSGLKPNDKVIINGQMRAYPGTTVAATEALLKIDPSIVAEMLREPIPASGTMVPASAGKSR